jgi:dihydroorotase (multifunctional complex type)
MVGGRLVEADLLVDGETIAGIVSGSHPDDAETTIDATGKVVLPGIIDTHCHAREPGYTNKEDFLTASRAGAVGGVTTFVDMPNVEPPTDTVERFEEKRALAAAKSILDWGHWSAGTNLAEIAKLAEAGTTGYKVFQVSGAYPHDPRLAINDEKSLLAVFRAIAETGLPLVIHPFNQSLFERLSEEEFARGEPPNSRTFSYVYTTDSIWQTAVNTLITLQQIAGTRLHLVHTHSKGALELIRAAKDRGQRVTAEVDPKYYHLTLEDLERQLGRVCPGGFITGDEERMAAIWRALNDGTIDNIGSDHAPHTLEEIAFAEVDAWRSALGSPQYDWYYSLVLTDVANGQLSLAAAVRLLSEGPARLVGVWPRKGTLAPGSDADLVVVDLDREVTLTDEGLETKCQWTPYLGWTLKGYVELTMLRGTVVARDRVIEAKPGFGRYIGGRAQ